MNIRLTGTKAILALIAVAAVVGIRLGMQREALRTDGIDEIERWLAVEAARIALPDMQSALAGSVDERALETLVEDLDADRFEIVSLTKHGSGDHAVVRVEYTHARSPSVTDVRYLRMRHSLVTGWRVRSETSRLGYYLALF